MRVRITFSKTEAMRFTGHLDLHRTWERTLRRAGLPLSYSQGFKPHARINLASALPLGFTSEGDLVDILLDNDLDLQEIAARLKRSAPPGILIEAIEQIDQGAPNLQAQLQAQEYVLIFPSKIANLDQRVAELMAAQSLPRQRNGKDYDLRPLILSLQRIPNGDTRQDRLLVCLSAREGETGRPEEVILALNGVPEDCRVHRRQLIFHSPVETTPITL